MPPLSKQKLYCSICGERAKRSSSTDNELLRQFKIFLQSYQIYKETEDYAFISANGCDDCCKILGDVSDVYKKLEDLLVKVKIKIITSFSRGNIPPEDVDAKFLKEFVSGADYLPQLILHRWDEEPVPPLPEDENVTDGLSGRSSPAAIISLIGNLNQCHIKEEVDIEPDADMENEVNVRWEFINEYETEFGTSVKTTVIKRKRKIKAECTASTSRETRSKRAKRAKLETNENGEENGEEDEEEAKEEEEFSDAIEPEPDNSDYESSDAELAEENYFKPIRKSRKLKAKPKQRQNKKELNLVENYQEIDPESLKLIPNYNDEGSYSFGGILLTPEASENCTKVSGALAAEEVANKKTIMNKYGKWKCGHCSLVMKGLYNLRSHVREIHFGLKRYGEEGEGAKKPIEEAAVNEEGKLVYQGIEIIEFNSETKFGCGSCPAVFKRQKNVFLHIQAKHGVEKPARKKTVIYGPQTEAAAMRAKSQKLENGAKLFCGVEITYKEDESGVLKYHCGRCCRRWTNVANAMSHIKRHHAESRPFSCPHCPLSFSYKYLFEEHQVTHKTERSYICEQCGVQCKREGSLRDHVRRVHLQLINYVCDHCGKGFYSKKDHRMHQNSHKR